MSLAAVSLSAVVLTIASPAGAESSPVTTYGYIPMKDGVKLRYTLIRPSTKGRFPLLFTHNDYEAGVAPYDANFALDLVAHHGFAILGVNVRGTGCSRGRFEVLEPQEAVDGAAVVEWAARQAWSTGHIGMFGQSYSGIIQLLVAAQRPKHLSAIAPGQIVADAYRDIGYPGGILNRGFAALYTPYQKQRSYSGAASAIADGDRTCATNFAEHPSERPFVVDIAESPFIDSAGGIWPDRSPDSVIGRIRVPVLTTRSWQDQQTGGRASYIYEQLDQNRLWSIQGNGGHTNFYDGPGAAHRSLVRFFLHFLKGEKNGWEKTPHFLVQHEIGSEGRERWNTSYRSWPPPASQLRLYLRADGVMSKQRPTRGESADSYLYPSLSPSAPDIDAVPDEAPQPNAEGWQLPPTPGGYLAYTTPRLTRDTEVLGSGNADLWISSTALDTDLQITLTEVRPDGQEVYLQRGWLRASHRREDPKRSTGLRPLHTHKQKDAQALVPGRPTHLRVELFPIGHVFRKGSSIRLIIDAPTGLTGDWGLDFLNTPARNTILHDAAHPSRFVLPFVAGSAHAKQPACGTVLNEPCRTSIAPVPSGRLNP
jgi:putative CocE/NonD family hydrolase